MVERVMIKRMKGIYRRGVIQLDEPLPLSDGAKVDVTVVATELGQEELQKTDESSWDASYSTPKRLCNRHRNY
jgi:predicted DNA-binding antitoxin AbrB/MazE fold protein